MFTRGFVGGKAQRRLDGTAGWYGRGGVYKSNCELSSESLGISKLAGSNLEDLLCASGKESEDPLVDEARRTSKQGRLMVRVVELVLI